MRTLSLLISMIGLGLTLLPSLLVFGGWLSWQSHSILMFAGMLCWFAFAPLWMTGDRR